MLPIRLGLASRSSSVQLRDLVSVAAAIGVQIERDLKPIWNVSATISAISDPDAIPLGVWPVYVVDDTGFDGAEGLHLTDDKQPYALVKGGRTWSLTASHECIEMLVDPSGNRLVSSAAVAVKGGVIVDLPDEKFEYLVEPADPSEDQDNAYMIDGVVVSDFYTPRYYDPSTSSGARYSFSGKITAPRQVLPGGYLSWRNPVLGRMQQLNWLDPVAGPKIANIPGRPSARGRSTLRGFVDQHMKTYERLSDLPPQAPTSMRQQSRSLWLARATALRSSAFTMARAPSDLAATTSVAAQAALDANLGTLKASGGTKAYVGWHFQNDWITARRAVVVLAPVSEVQVVRSRLPLSFGDVPVDVRPDPRPQLSAPGTALLFASGASGTVREELAVPDFAGEVLLQGDAGSPGLLEARRQKPVVQYTPPPGYSLEAREYDVTLTLHISPEQGWAELDPFIRGTQSSLVVGMYEFTAPHIDRAVTETLGSTGNLTLTLDSPGEQPGKREQTVEDTETDLENGLQTRLQFAWALSGLGKESVAKAFPTAYHIKVVVRDSSAFWLSSGNFNSSNQPNVDPTDQTALVQAFEHSDRDWHLICQCPELATIFEAYLRNDYAEAARAAQNAAAAAGLAAAIPSVAPPSPLDAIQMAARTPKRFFPPKVVTGKIRIKPLLTPDDYRRPILDLIKGTESRFYMQTQYIHTIAPDDDNGDIKHMDLITAVADLIKRGIDVRLITSEYQTRPWIEKLQDAGIDAANFLRIQKNVHNKGMIVDSKTCVVSSQNWSGEGTGSNRDAGLIIYSAEASRYFEEIFLHDWVNLARPQSLL